MRFDRLQCVALFRFRIIRVVRYYILIEICQKSVICSTCMIQIRFTHGSVLRAISLLMTYHYVRSTRWLCCYGQTTILLVEIKTGPGFAESFAIFNLSILLLHENLISWHSFGCQTYFRFMRNSSQKTSYTKTQLGYSEFETFHREILN